MINRALLTTKMEAIKQYYEEMKPVLEIPARQIIDDIFKLKFIERNFQLIVDTALDINTHIISSHDLPVPDDYQTTFETLGKNNILPQEFSMNIAPSVGLRNRVVHKYGQVDLKRMIDEIKKNIHQYLEYLKHIDTYLKSSAAI